MPDTPSAGGTCAAAGMGRRRAPRLAPRSRLVPPWLVLPWAAPPWAAPPWAARAASLLRPAYFARWPVAAPVLALAIGAGVPHAAEAAVAALVPTVAALVFCAVAGAEAGRLDGAEAARTVALVAGTMLACPAVIAGAAALAGLGPDLACAAVLVAGGPVSMGGGVMAARFGLPPRPMVWASAAGTALVPLTLPLVASVAGQVSLPAPGALGLAAAWLAGAPLAAALAARRFAPRLVAAGRAELRGAVVLLLAVLACSAGGRTAAALGHPRGWECCAVALGVQFLAVSTGWTIGALLASLGRPGFGFRLGSQLALGGSMRNTSIAWASALAAGGVAPRTEDVVGAFVALIFVVPALASVAARWPFRGGARSGPSEA